MWVVMYHENKAEWHDEKINKVYRCTQKYTAIPFDIAIKHSIFLLLSCPVIWSLSFFTIDFLDKMQQKATSATL